LFTDNYTKTPTNTPSPFRLCITHIVQLRLVNSQSTNMLRYVISQQQTNHV